MNKIKKYFSDIWNNPERKRNLLYSLIFAVLIMGFYTYSSMNKDEIKEQSIAKFLEFIETDEVKNIKEPKIVENKRIIQYKLDDFTYQVKFPAGGFLVQNPQIFTRLSLAESNGVEKKDKTNDEKSEANFVKLTEEQSIGSTLAGVIFSLFNLLFFVFIGYILFQMLGFTKDSLVEVENEKITFKDIAGYRYVKEELNEVVDFLNHPENYKRYTDKGPKGILLEGPPGNGKTFFAKAIAGESKTPFFQISGADIEDKFVGSGSQRVKKIFEKVRKKVKESGKAILFIDEIDAVGMKRENRTVIETNQTINKLLTEMDGFNKDDKILIIGATNFADSLDNALTRSGRFDRVIQIPRPNLKDREEVIKLYLNKKGDLIDKEVFEENYPYTLAKQTEGACNADLDKLINEASLFAKKQKKTHIDIKCLREAFTKVIAGIRTETELSDEERKIVAYHEAGHATVQAICDSIGYKSIAYITITPRGQSLGHVVPVSDHQVLMRKSHIKNDIKMSFGGRAVEEKILDGDYTTGASSDLQHINRLLHSYVAKYGMSDSIENLFIENLDENSKIVQEQIKIVREQLYNETKDLIDKHFDVVEKIAERLLENESIDQIELVELLKGTSYEDVHKL